MCVPEKYLGDFIVSSHIIKTDSILKYVFMSIQLNSNTQENKKNHYLFLISKGVYLFSFLQNTQ